MPRIRTLKPEALQHRKVGRLSDRAFRLWITLVTQADDQGRGLADAEQLRLLAFGYHPGVRAKHVERALEEIAGLGLVTVYEAVGARYVAFPSWSDHQRIHKNHFTPSRLPAPPMEDAGGMTPVSVRDESRTRPVGSEGIGSDRIGKERIGGDGSAREGEPPPARSGGAPAAPSNGRAPTFNDLVHQIEAAHPDLSRFDVERAALAEVTGRAQVTRGVR